MSAGWSAALRTQQWRFLSSSRSLLRQASPNSSLSRLPANRRRDRSRVAVDDGDRARVPAPARAAYWPYRKGSPPGVCTAYRLQDFRSQASLARASGMVCHCMFEMASGPPQASGMM
jgi:hypothetical protein